MTGPRHTDSDHAAILAAGLDPDDVQPREHAVPCGRCPRMTFNIAARCDHPDHYLPPARTRRTVAA